MKVIRTKLLLPKLSLFICISVLSLIFLYNPHFIELSETLESWFPTKGLTYYRDFAAFHFPLARLILIPIHVLSNWNLEIDPFIGLATGIGTLILIYFFGKNFLSQSGTSVALLFFTVFFWFAATGILFFHEMLIGLLLAGITLLLFTIYQEKYLQGQKLFFLGILVSLAELSGQIVTITLAVIGLLSLFVILSKTKNLRKSLRYIFLLSLGVIIPISLLSLSLLVSGAFNEFFYGSIAYYLRYASHEKNITALPVKELIAFYSPFIVLASTIILRLKEKNNPSYSATVFLLLCISTIPFILFSVYHPHHLNYALPILAITAGLTYDNSKLAGFTGSLIFLIGAIFLIYSTLTLIIPWHLDRFVFPPNFRIMNDLYPDSKDPMNDAVGWVAKNTTKNAKILVVGDPLFYLRSDRLPASRPSKGMPYTWDPLEDIKKEILSKPPNYWVVDKHFLQNLITNYNRKDQFDFVNQELENCCNKVANFDSWEVWQQDK